MGKDHDHYHKDRDANVPGAQPGAAARAQRVVCDLDRWRADICADADANQHAEQYAGVADDDVDQHAEQYAGAADDDADQNADQYAGAAVADAVVEIRSRRGDKTSEVSLAKTSEV